MAAPVAAAVGMAVGRAVAMASRMISSMRLKSLLSFKRSRHIDTGAFDYAVGRIMRDWKPPPDIKRVIVSELGAVLALTSNATLCAGPKVAKLKAPSKARSYLKKKYTWKSRKGSVQNKESIPSFRISGVKYYRRRYAAPLKEGGYRGPTKTFIKAFLAITRKKAMDRAGSSKAMWLYMWDEVKRTTGVNPRTFPATWDYVMDVRNALNHIKKSSKWKAATEAQNMRVPKGDFVIKVYSESHNTLNPGSKGGSFFQAKINGREKYVQRALTKATVASLKKMIKKFPGMEVHAGIVPPGPRPPVLGP